MASTSIISSCITPYMSINPCNPATGGYDTYGEAASPADFEAATPQANKIGQMVYDWGGGIVYYINRAYLSFDTSVIPGTVLGASLWVTGAKDYALSGPWCPGTCGADFDVQVYRYNFTTTNGDIAPDDATGSQNWHGAYGPDASLIGTLSDTSVDYWEYAASSISNFGIEVPASMIDTAGSTRFTMVSSRDISSTSPTVAASDLNAFQWWWEAVWAAGMYPPTSYGGSAGWPRLCVTFQQEGTYGWIF